MLIFMRKDVRCVLRGCWPKNLKKLLNQNERVMVELEIVEKSKSYENRKESRYENSHFQSENKLTGSNRNWNNK